MKKILLLSIVFLCRYISYAQKVHFIYVQSDKGYPFYIKLGNKIFPSSAEGYLILSQLKDSTYNFTLGLAKTEEEAQVSVVVNKKDRGFLLKNTAGELSLIDLQTLAVYKALPVEKKAQRLIKDDNFTKLLALAANDLTLLYEPVAAQDVAKSSKASASVEIKEGVKDYLKESTEAAAESKANTEPANPEPKEIIQKDETKQVQAEKGEIAGGQPKVEAGPQEKYIRSVITRKSESSTTEGLGLVFLDNYNGIIDTVRILIPNPKIAFTETSPAQLNDDRRFLEISSQQETLSGRAAVPNKNPNCATQATDREIKKIGKIMSSRQTEEAMFEEAKAFLSNKCFTTEQIKNLSAFFRTPSVKYKFFEAAYPHVSDQKEFVSLQSEFKDDYFLNSFKTLVAQ